jgi:hypothetical protein
MTPEQWRSYLEAKLDDRLKNVDPVDGLYPRYYRGEHRLQFATSKFKETFGDLFEAFATNWCGLVVDVAVERLEILGFRIGDDDADEEAWSIYRANGMARQSRTAHEEAIKCEESYLWVGPGSLPGGEPLITVEHPSQVIVELDPEDPRRRLAALKRYRDANGDIVCVVVLPNTTTEFRRKGAVAFLTGLGVSLPTGIADWDVVSEEPNPLGVVPVVPLENSPELLTGGQSDLAPAIALNDAANKFFLDMIVGSEYTSYPQRVLTGVELPRDPITGEIKDDQQIRAALNRLWAFEDPAARVFDLPPQSLSNFVEGVDLAVQHLAAQTRTPPHYLLAKLANISGDALIAAETGLNSRCRAKHLNFSDRWNEAIRLAFKWRSIMRAGWPGAGDDAWRAQVENMEVIWADPEQKDPVSLAQSLTMKQAIGVPPEVLWEEAGYTPQQIKRMKTLRDAELERQQKLAEAGAAPGGSGAAPTVGIAAEGDKLALSGLPGPPPEPQGTPKDNGKPKPKAPAGA